MQMGGKAMQPVLPKPSTASTRSNSSNAPSVIEDKELRKKLRNRQSALAARERKKARMLHLEQTVAELQSSNERLSDENMKLKRTLGMYLSTKKGVPRDEIRCNPTSSNEQVFGTSSASSNSFDGTRNRELLEHPRVQCSPTNVPFAPCSIPGFGPENTVCNTSGPASIGYSGRKQANCMRWGNTSLNMRRPCLKAEDFSHHTPQTVSAKRRKSNPEKFGNYSNNNFFSDNSHNVPATCNSAPPIGPCQSSSGYFHSGSSLSPPVFSSFSEAKPTNNQWLGVSPSLQDSADPRQCLPSIDAVLGSPGKADGPSNASIHSLTNSTCISEDDHRTNILPPWAPANGGSSNTLDVLGFSRPNTSDYQAVPYKVPNTIGATRSTDFHQAFSNPVNTRNEFESPREVFRLMGSSFECASSCSDSGVGVEEDLLDWLPDAQFLNLQ